MSRTPISLKAGNYFQDWSNTALLNANDDWSGVAGIVGYLGDVSASTTAGAVPATSTQPLLGAVDLIANQTNPNTNNSGGVAEFQIADAVVALQGSGTADQPSLVLYLDATERQDLKLSYDLRDIDGSTDNAVQPINVQYRLGDAADWTSLPGALVADASVGPSLTNSVSYAFDLPAELNGQAGVQVRFVTTNATGSDEWIGIDNIRVTSIAGGASDSVAPTLLSSTPTDDGTGVSSDANIVLVFSEPVSAATGSITITDNNGDTRVIAIGDTSQVTISGAQVTINPAADLRQGATYQVSIAAGALRDSAGNTYAGTGADPIDFTTVDPLAVTSIGTIQGEGHVSAFAGATVLTQGVVTAIDTTGARGFWLQDPNGDGNARTSDGIFVFTSALTGIAVGDSYQVSGTVTEFVGGNGNNLSITELTSPTLTRLSTSLGTVQSTIIGAGGVLPPTSVIDNDRFATFDPQQDGADFYESLESMLVTIQNAQAVGPTSSTGSTWVVADRGAGATGMNDRGGITISGNDIVTADFNPERIQVFVDSGVASLSGTYSTGSVLGAVTGVVGYFGGSNASGGNYQVVATGIQNQSVNTTVARETTTLRGDATRMSFAEYNVENLDPRDTKFAQLGRDIAINLGSPDVIALEEIQDADGAGNGTNYSGATTLQALVDAIAAAGGARYGFVEVAPTANGTTGGEPGGNIRNAFLYNLDRVGYVAGSAELIRDPDLGNGDAFRNSRQPLAAEFVFNDQVVTAIAVHSTSRGGSDSLYGANQPPANAGDQARIDQSAAIRAYVTQLQQADPNAKVVVAGDFNAFQFETSLTLLEQGGSLTNLSRLLAPEERYTYVFEGNSQQLDHILASGNLAGTAQFDVVHLNSGAAGTVATDHDPTLALFAIAEAFTFGAGNDFGNYQTSETAVTVRTGAGDDSVTGSAFNDSLYGGSGFDRLRGGEGNDTIVGGTGFDRVQGGAGSDTFLFAAGDLVDPRANGGQMDHIIDFQGAGTNNMGAQDFLSFTGFGSGAQLRFAYLLSNNPALQVYEVVTNAGVQGSLIVQMADTTNQLTTADYGFFG